MPRHRPNRSGSGDQMTRHRRRAAASRRMGAATPPAVAPTPRPYATQPWNRIVWPWEGVAGTPVVYDTWSALRIPGVARATSIYAGSLKQAPLDDYLGVNPQTRPRLLEAPDPNQGRGWFVQCQVEDYLWNGNAVCYITARKNGWPAAVTWLPAAWVSIACPPKSYADPIYMIDGIELDRRNVVHVKRGADRWCPARGVSVIEQHLATLDRVAMEEDYERDALRNGAVPSVAVITPNPRVGDDEVKTAKAEWMAKFAGPGREPAILPAGTQVVPLAWSPEDSQLVEARKMSLLDVANAFNLDGYWLGAPGGSMTYRSPGAMYTNLLRVSLEPVLTDFEDVWSMAWLPRGHRVRFDRLQLARDDVQTTVQTMVAAITSTPPLMTQAEARAYMGLPINNDIMQTSPVDTAPTDQPPADQPPPEEAP